MNDFNVKKLKYDIDQVLYHFGLERHSESAMLDSLLQVEVPADYELPLLLEQQRVMLALEGDVWNEEELKMHFLSPLFLLSDLQVPKKMKLFYERPLAGIVQSTVVSVVCDALLASPMGINTPQKPYFFLQEFKKGKNTQNDAEGQMLVAMLIAQTLNNDQQPLYGCYLQGRYWYFSVLYERFYCLSGSYDATRPRELAQIVHILQHIKYLVKQ
ncbi:MAG: hypothetical protein JNM36_03515 [Chitinophagales bacterium]|jgi:hypothetical protein|nr:hypothetical protein [Chitinophagales bacterium]HNI43249.1 hypothetical protein [Chitinophagales bacterium]